jgi:hypothetical protein
MPYELDSSVTDRPIYWYAVLEQALDRGDLEAAARAQKELRRLGIDVRYRRHPSLQGVSNVR